MECPICDRVPRGDRCVCGYEVATGDRRSAALRARRDRARGEKVLVHGLRAVAASALLLVIGIPTLGIAAALGALVPIALAGSSVAVAGAHRRQRALRRLARATEPVQLPPARIV